MRHYVICAVYKYTFIHIIHALLIFAIHLQTRNVVTFLFCKKKDGRSLWFSLKQYLLFSLSFQIWKHAMESNTFLLIALLLPQKTALQFFREIQRKVKKHTTVSFTLWIPVTSLVTPKKAHKCVKWSLTCNLLQLAYTWKAHYIGMKIVTKRLKKCA